MQDQTTTRPTCHWVPVTDASGRTRLEARWNAPAGAKATPRAA